jgi:hypothetical protein
MEQMLNEANWPHSIFIKHESKGYKIKKKLFHELTPKAL